MKRKTLRGLYAPELLEARIAPATFTVTSLADDGSDTALAGVVLIKSAKFISNMTDLGDGGGMDLRDATTATSCLWTRMRDGRWQVPLKIALAIPGSPATFCASFLRHWRSLLDRPVGENNR